MVPWYQSIVFFQKHFHFTVRQVESHVEQKHVEKYSPQNKLRRCVSWVHFGKVGRGSLKLIANLTTHGMIWGVMWSLRNFLLLSYFFYFSFIISFSFLFLAYKYITPRGQRTLCNGPETPTQWKAESATDLLTDQITNWPTGEGARDLWSKMFVFLQVCRLCSFCLCAA